MLKITISLEKLISEKLEVNDGVVDRFDIDGNSMEHTKKSKKSKGQ